MIRVTGENIEIAQRLVQRDFPEVDLSLFVANKMNFCLVKGESGCLFAWRGPHIYETHIFLAERGRQAIEAMDEFLEWMRDEDARLFWAAIPVHDRKVIMFARLMGWKYRQTSELPEGQCQIFSSE